MLFRFLSRQPSRHHPVWRRAARMALMKMPVRAFGDGRCAWGLDPRLSLDGDEPVPHIRAPEELVARGGRTRLSRPRCGSSPVTFPPEGYRMKDDV